MFLKNKNFIYSNSFEDLYQHTMTTIPSTLLINGNMLLNNTKQVLRILEDINIKWIIVIGENPLALEEYLDSIVETILYNFSLDIITTSFKYDEVEDIIFEFLVTSKLGAGEYQFISILDFDNPKELKILELINKEIEKLA